MDNRDYMKAFGEWLCSIAPNPAIKSILHLDMSDMYGRDYVMIQNLCNGYWTIPEISITSIDGAKECYKQFYKSLLETSSLPNDKKRIVSFQIDTNAEDQKQKWITILRNKGIKITV